MPNQPGENFGGQPNSSQPNSFVPPTQNNFADQTRIAGKNDLASLAQSNPNPGMSNPPVPSAQNPFPAPAAPTTPMPTNAPANMSGGPGQAAWGAAPNQPGGFNPGPMSQPNQPVGAMAQPNQPMAAPPQPGFSAPGVAPVQPGGYSSAMPGSSMSGTPQVMPVQDANQNNLFAFYMANFKDIWKGNLVSALERVRGNTAYAFTLLGVTIALAAFSGGLFTFNTIYAGGHIGAGLISSQFESYVSSSISNTAAQQAGKAFVFFLIVWAILVLNVQLLAMVLSRMNRDPESTPLNFSQASVAASFALFPAPILMIPVLLLFMLPSAATLFLGLILFMLESAMLGSTTFIALFKAVRHYANISKYSIAQFALIYTAFSTISFIFIFVIGSAFS